MSGHRYPWAIAFAAAMAAVFFFAGYSVRTAHVALAAPTHPIRDGNPVGHNLVPKGTPGMVPGDLARCLKLIAKTPLAIRYVTAKPAQLPHLPKPTCNGNSPCVTFLWKNMDIQTIGPAPSFALTGHETVDVYGTLAVK